MNRIAERLVRDDGIAIRVVAGDNPLMRQVADLCYETLHRPFGVVRNDAWNETDPSSSHVVATEGERLVGYARLIRDGATAHIRQVTVAPVFRRRGIATQLMGVVLEIAAREGFRSAFLYARVPAVPTYQRLGFAVSGPAFRMGRTWVPHVRMEKSLR